MLHSPPVFLFDSVMLPLQVGRNTIHLWRKHEYVVVFQGPNFMDQQYDGARVIGRTSQGCDRGRGSARTAPGKVTLHIPQLYVGFDDYWSLTSAAEGRHVFILPKAGIVKKAHVIWLLWGLKSVGTANMIVVLCSNVYSLSEPSHHQYLFCPPFHAKADPLPPASYSHSAQDANALLLIAASQHTVRSATLWTIEQSCPRKCFNFYSSMWK